MVLIYRLMLFIITVISLQSATGQNNRIDYLAYYKFINEAEIATISKNYNSADSIFKIGFNKVSKPFAQDLFLAAINAHHKKDINLTEHYLEESFKNGLQFRQIRKSILNTYLSQEEKRYKRFKKKYKSLRKHYKTGLNKSRVRKGIYNLFSWKKQKKAMQKIGNKNFSRIVSVCNQNGFPGRSLIGDNLKRKYDVEDISLLMRHMDKYELDSLKPFILKSIFTGELHPWHYASAFDYCQMFKTDITDLDEDGNHIMVVQQKLGTMSYTDENGKHIIFPIENLEKATSIRKEIGLEPLTDYAKKRGWEFPREGFYEKKFIKKKK